MMTKELLTAKICPHLALVDLILLNELQTYNTMVSSSVKNLAYAYFNNVNNYVQLETIPLTLHTRLINQWWFEWKQENVQSPARLTRSAIVSLC